MRVSLSKNKLVIIHVASIDQCTHVLTLSLLFFFIFFSIKVKLKMHKSICYQIIRLQELEKQMVGGENKDNKTLKEKRKKRKLFADERKQRLAGGYQCNKTSVIQRNF